MRIIYLKKELDIYLDNIGSGDLFQTKRQYESKITVIFKLLAKKYRSLLDQIFQVYEFSRRNKIS